MIQDLFDLHRIFNYSLSKTKLAHARKADRILETLEAKPSSDTT
jgi:hypothetical protein